MITLSGVGVYELWVDVAAMRSNATSFLILGMISLALAAIPENEDHTPVIRCVFATIGTGTLLGAVALLLPPAVVTGVFLSILVARACAQLAWFIQRAGCTMLTVRGLVCLWAFNTAWLEGSCAAIMLYRCWGEAGAFILVAVGLVLSGMIAVYSVSWLEEWTRTRVRLP